MLILSATNDMDAKMAPSSLGNVNDERDVLEAAVTQGRLLVRQASRLASNTRTSL